MTAMPETNQPEKTYQPNMVLNQWVSMDMSQSHAITDELTAKNTTKTVETLRIFHQRAVPPI